ncbi:hypothetical protein L1987_47270 [Smallanthus sonchifolius]|uniref:Uncharacterized protein n=1 Tax=Smallanthus sonchifolius TaxID=185202 RepID=A0ACB9G323_9ASTR|nr:hypothetical protein L1987_47270 [Smallanthus sonchifolius]
MPPAIFHFLALIATVLFCASISATAATAEIQALISFKENVHDPLGALDGWNTSTPSAPCDWRGVSCSDGRVRELRLPRLALSGRLTSRISELSQLRRLTLHANKFHGSIPSALSQCSLLRVVYLQYNYFTGVLPPAFGNLTNLLVLNVAHNLLSGEISGNLPPTIRYFDVSSNALSGNIPWNLSAASQIQLINLSFNSLSGQIPPIIGTFQNLQYLFLDSNELYGTLPSAIANCSSLIHFTADDNQLQGLIPASIGNLPYLQTISLSGNALSGSIPPTLLSSIDSSIRIINLGFNALTSLLQTLNSTTFSRSVEVLDLHENHINQTFPIWLTNLHTLTDLDLSGNSFSGILPAEIGNLLSLEELKIANNSVTGEVPIEIGKCRLLNVLDLEGNRFAGPIPDVFWGLLSLRFLSFGRNLFNGSLPASIAELSELELLNLSNNNFSGNFPMAIGDLTGLTELNMSGCKFSGEIPAVIENLRSLSVLDLSKQSFSGELPVELFGLPNLKVVALEENNFSGDVLESFSSLSSLQRLNLSSNSFSGDIPVEFGFISSLGVLSISDNGITKSIPAALGNLSNLEVLELGRNVLTGSVPVALFELSDLKRLDLSHNRLTGEIPENISDSSSLNSLLLDSNHFSGQIPESLSKLSKLTELDLSINNLTGEIPASLSTIPNLKQLNLSRNDLEGEIPKMLGSRFTDPSVFDMNNRLCGKPSERKCKREISSRKKKLILLICLAAGGGLVLLISCCGYVFPLLRWRRKLLRMGKSGEVKKPSPPRGSSGRDNSSRGENSPPKVVIFKNKITYADVLEATRQFDEENVMSRGTFGLVFKASFADGIVISIRRLPETSVSEATFQREAESLGKVKHQNLTVLRGYFASRSDNVRLLVYDYMPNGNLATLLQEASHQDGHVLNWPMRHLIALGIARGLAFLHSIPMVHGDIKPQNILFDADFEAHISDFGLNKLTVPTQAEPSTSTTASSIGTLGYVAPEATLTGQTTKEADVYSYGVVLLELLTGKNPVMFNHDEDIVKWVNKQLQRGQISELLEPGLLELDPESSEGEEFLLGLKVALLCTTSDSTSRPSMSDVVFMLEGCRVGPDMPSSADPTSLPSPI